VAIVDGLELVDVEDDQAEGRLVALGSLNLPVELLLEGSMVPKPGELIGERIRQCRLVADVDLIARLLQGLDHQAPQHRADQRRSGDGADRDPHGEVGEHVDQHALGHQGGNRGERHGRQQAQGQARAAHPGGGSARARRAVVHASSSNPRRVRIGMAHGSSPAH
jgi:hypothetical protein